MAKSVVYLIAVYFIGSLAINIIEELVKLNDPEINKSIEKFGTELQEFINNRIQEESTNND